MNKKDCENCMAHKWYESQMGWHWTGEEDCPLECPEDEEEEENE